jgi:transposase-like protein
VAPTRRVTLREAADILGVSKEAIRKRVVRKTLRSDTGEDGRRYVYLDTGGDEAPTHESDALISELRAHNATLREQLQAERQAHAEARRIIAGLVERMPAIEPPQEEHSPGPDARGSPETVENVRESQPRPDTPGPSEDVQRPWWRRVFRG